MSLWLLLPVVNDCRKHSSIRRHDRWVENKLDVLVLVWGHFHFLWFNLEGKLLYGILILFLCLKFDVTCHLVVVDNFYLLNNPFRIFRRHQSSKVENPFINEKHI